MGEHCVARGGLAKTVDADHRALIRTPDQPGLYTLSYDKDPAIQQVLAVNPPAKESELTYLQAEPDIIKAWTLSKPEDAAGWPCPR